MDDEIRLGLTSESLDKRLRGFGTGLAVILAIFALLSWRRSGQAAPFYAAGCAAAALSAWAKPTALGPLYHPWMKVVLFIGAINAYLLMGLIYFMVFTPYGLLLRLFGRNPLTPKKPDSGSLWVEREPLRDYNTYERQF